MAKSQPNSSSAVVFAPTASDSRQFAALGGPFEIPRADTSAARVRRQSAINMAGGLLSQGVKFLVVIYVARSFSPVQFGWLSFAIAVNAFLFIMAHFGLPVYGSRAVARVGVIHSDMLLNICLTRALLSLVGTGVALAILWFVPMVSREELLLVAIFGLSNAPVAGLIDWVFQGLHRQDISAILNIVWQLLWLGFIVLGVRGGASILVVPAALCGSALLTALLGYLWLTRSYGIAPGSVEDSNQWQRSSRLLTAGTALGTGTLLITVLVWTDAIIIRLLRGDEAVGLYAAGNRAALALAMLASYFVQGAFPLLSSAAGSGNRFNACFQQCYEDLALAFVPVSFWSIFYSREIIEILFKRPEYQAAAVVFQIFQLVFLVTVFANLYGTGVLVANHRDTDYRRSLMMATTVFVPLCASLVYLVGILGAAFAALTAQALCAYFFVRKSRGLVRVDHRRALLVPVAIGLLMVAISGAFHLTVLWSIPALLLGYGALTAMRLQWTS